jgi:hypothetical protein
LSLKRTAEQLKTAVQSQPFVPLEESDLTAVLTGGLIEKAIAEEVELVAIGQHRLTIDMSAGSTLCWKFQLQQGEQWSSFNQLAEAVGFRLVKEVTPDHCEDLPWTGMRRSSNGLHGLYTSSEKPVVGLWGSALQACTLHLVWDNPSSMGERTVRYNVKLVRPAAGDNG